MPEPFGVIKWHHELHQVTSDMTRWMGKSPATETLLRWLGQLGMVSKEITERIDAETEPVDLRHRRDAGARKPKPKRTGRKSVAKPSGSRAAKRSRSKP